VKTTRETQRGWLLTFGAITLAAAVSGCSMLIAKSGISSVGEIDKPQTRAEVREAFGEPDETDTCPDGRIVERRTIRQQASWVCQGSSGCGEAYLRTVGLFDVFVVPVQLYRMEQAKLHYAWVYGSDERVLYLYNVTSVPSTRFGEAVSPLTVALYGQLEERGCPSWVGCVSAFAAEVRQRAACVGYTLSPEEAETLQWLQALAAEVDAGLLAPDDTLAELQWCLGSTPLSCLRP
jgi:hypothetical protein